MVRGSELSRYQLRQIVSGLARIRAPRRRRSQRRATVACILRHPKMDSRSDSLEMLLMLRQRRKHSRFSGQVGFPGGHFDSSTDRDDVDTVIRETKEELGIDLTRSGIFLGTLPERIPPKLDLTVCCHVHMSHSSEEALDTSVRLDPTEVSACGWVPVSSLVSPNITPLTGEWRGHPSIDLSDSTTDFLVERGGSEEELQRRFVLWGLTLSVVSDLLSFSGLRNEGFTRGSRIG